MKKILNYTAVFISLILSFVIASQFVNIIYPEKHYSRRLAGGIIRSRPVIAYIEIDKIIYDLRGEAEFIYSLPKRNVKALVLRINSPGGGVVSSQEIYYALKYLKKKNIKIYSFVDDICASGGYYIACASDEIYVYPGSLVGSVGIMMQHSNFKGLLDKAGIEFEFLTTGEEKAVGHPYGRLKEKDKEYLYDILNSHYDHFMNAVKTSRNLTEEQAEKVSTARVFTGTQAVEIGLADKIGTFEDLKNDLKKTYGIRGEIEFLEYTQPQKGYSIFFSEASAAVKNFLRYTRMKKYTNMFYLWE